MSVFSFSSLVDNNAFGKLSTVGVTTRKYMANGNRSKSGIEDAYSPSLLA